MSTETRGGLWQTPTNTPTGAAMQVSVDNPYITKSQFILNPIAKGLGITASSTEYTDGTLDAIILEASSMVNRYCRRHFDRQTIDEIYPNITIQVTNPQLTTVPLDEGPINQINTIYIQVLQWFIEFSLSYLQTIPEAHYYQIVPLLSSDGSTGIPIPSVLLQQSNLGKIWTNYDYGYSRQIVADTSTADSGKTIYTFTTPLWVKSTTSGVTPVIYVNGVAASSSSYSINYRDGIVTFTGSQGSATITATYWTYYQALPQEVVQATILIAGKLFATRMNPLGLVGFKTMNTAYNWAEYNPIDDQVRQLLDRLCFPTLSIT